jgi:hypothetical protein
MKNEPNTSSGEGVICNAGGDKHKYLGHFRSKATMERGHNQGAPGGVDVLSHPALNPISNPQGMGATDLGSLAGGKVGGNVGAPVAKAGPVKAGGPLSPVAQPGMQKVGGNMQAAPGAQLGIMGTPGAGPAKPPADAGAALNGLAKLVGGSGAKPPNRSTGAGAGSTSRSRPKVKTSNAGGGTPVKPQLKTMPKAELQSNTDVLRKTRQGVRNTMRGGAKRKNPRM